MSAHARRFTDRAWLSDNQVGKLLRLTNARHKDPVVWEKEEQIVTFARIFLNEVINRAVSKQLLRTVSKTEWQKIGKLAAKVSEYVERTERLKEIGYPYAKLSPHVVSDVKRMSREIQQAFSTRQLRYELWERIFYPGCMGIYAAIFDHEPVATARQMKADELGPTAIFIVSVIEIVRHTQEAEEIHTHFTGGNRSNLIWRVPQPDSVRVKISEFKKMTYDCSDRIWWEGERDMFKRRMADPA